MTVTEETAPVRTGHPHRVDAGAMLLAVEFDPQFRMPRRPRFIPGLVLVPMPEGLLVEGASERQTFRGRAATGLLPRLIPLLDGDRDIDAVGRELPGVFPADLRAALALLYTSGLLEEGADSPPADGDLPAPVRAFLARTLDTTRADLSTDAAVRRTVATRIGVCGAGVPALLPLLAEFGLHAAPLPATACDPAGVADLGLVVAVDAAGPGAAGSDGVGSDGVGVDLARLDAACAAAGVPWLRVAVRGSTVEVGPRFDRSHTPCYDCFAAASAEPSPVDAPTPLWPAIAAHEVFQLASRTGTAVSLVPACYRHVDVAAWSSTMRLWARRPACGTCQPPRASDAPATAPLAYLYDQAVTFPPRRLIDPKAHQMHYRASNLAMQTEHRSYHTTRRVELAAPDMGKLDPGGYGFPEALAVVLRAAFGVKPGDHDVRAYRFPPTGGNLGSPQVFLYAREASGFDRGLYYYEPFAHQLSDLGLTDLDRVEPVLAGDAPDLLAVLVVTSALGRIEKKYGPPALRICSLDAGVAMHQIRAVGHAVGLRCRQVETWDDAAVGELLQISHRQEPVMGLVHVMGEGRR